MTLVGKKSFIVMTILIPFLILIVGCIPVLLSYINSTADTSVTRIAVIDETGRYSGALKDNDNYRFIRLSGQKVDNPHDFYIAADESIDAVMVIPSGVEESQQVNLYSEKTLGHNTLSYLSRCLDDTLQRAKIAAMGDPDLFTKMEQAQVNTQVKNIKWDEQGDEQEQSA